MERRFKLSKVDILSFVLKDIVKQSWENGFQIFSEPVKGERLWPTPVKIVGQLQANLDICAILVEMHPNAAFAVLPRWTPSICAGTNWQP
jgi:hypothetical protein